MYELCMCPTHRLHLATFHRPQVWNGFAERFKAKWAEHAADDKAVAGLYSGGIMDGLASDVDVDGMRNDYLQDVFCDSLGKQLGRKQAQQSAHTSCLSLPCRHDGP